MTIPSRIDPANMASPGGHYSHASVANGFVFISGQLPIAADGTKLNTSSFAEQTVQVLSNINNALVASGSSIEQLAQVRVYVTDIEHWPEFNRLYAEWAGDSRPSRAVVPVPNLHFGFLLEVEAVATV